MHAFSFASSLNVKWSAFVRIARMGHFELHEPEQILSEKEQDKLGELVRLWREGVSQEWFEDILDAHDLWLQSKGQSGVQADLTDANLTKLQLSGVHLSQVKLNGADLHGVDLKGALLKEADLTDANVREADLERVDLRSASLLGLQWEGAKINLASIDKNTIERSQWSDAQTQRWKKHGGKVDSSYNYLPISTAILEYRPFPLELIEELDDLTYRRSRTTSGGTSYTAENDQRLRDLVTTLWQYPKAKAGDVVAGAKLIEIIGKGAFGTVWRALTVEGEQLRAVKIFDSDRLGEGLAAHLFRRGVQAMLYLKQELQKELEAGSLDPYLSRTIVQIREYEPNRLAFAMNLIPGKDLSHGNVFGRPLEEKLKLFKLIANSVAFGHTREKTVVHRDIKPQNIVMGGDLPVLTDFDISDMAFAKTLSQRAYAGALGYAAPEQLSNECRDLEPRSDVYSLGRLLHFFLLEDEPPIHIEEVPILADLSHCPEGLVKIIRRCTHRALAPRYNTIAALLEDLDRYEEVDVVGSYGPCEPLGVFHWQKAMEFAQNRRFKEAIFAGQQALRYIEQVDTKRFQIWEAELQKWRLRQGEYRLLPSVMRYWGQQYFWILLFATAAVVLGAMGWLFYSILQREPQEAHIHALLAGPRKDPQRYQDALLFFRYNKRRLEEGQKKLVKHWEAHEKGEKACWAMYALYHLTKGSKLRFPGKVTRRHNLSGAMRRYGVRKFSNRYWFPEPICPRGLKLKGVIIENQHLDKVVIDQADFFFGYIKGTFMRRASLKEANFKFSFLQNGQWEAIDLTDAIFDFAYLENIALHKAQLPGASFRFASIKQTKPKVLYLREALLQFADFRGADFSGNVNFSYSNVWGALFNEEAVKFLWKGGLDKNQLKNARCYTETFFVAGSGKACRDWHHYPASHSHWKGQPKPKPPSMCPKVLRGPLIAYPKGWLQEEGVCPWQERKLPSFLEKVIKSAAVTSRPSSRPVIFKKK